MALAVWELYLNQTLGYWAFKDDLHVLTTPFAGWAETFTLATYVSDGGGRLRGSSDRRCQRPSACWRPGCVLLIGAAWALRLRDPLDLAYLGMTLLSFSLTWRNLYFAKDMIRQMSPVLLLLPAVDRRRPPGEPARPPAPMPPDLMFLSVELITVSSVDSGETDCRRAPEGCV